MKVKILAPLVWVLFSSLPLLGQEKLYPVRPGGNIPAILTSDRSAFVVERAFRHRLTLGFPSDDMKAYLPDTRAPLTMLWLRIQNVSQSPMQFDITQFSSFDNAGRMFAVIAPEEAANRIIEGAASGSLGTKALRGISLGRAAAKRTEDDVRDDIARYSLHSGEIPPGAVREGLIYFEAPPSKKFNIQVTLGDLWSQPLAFSTEKQK